MIVHGIVPLMLMVTIGTSLELEVLPSEVRLEGARDFQTLIVRSRDESGATTDWRATSRITCSKPGLVRIEDNIIRPLVDGEAELYVSVGEASARIPLTVTNAGTKQPVSFRHHVMPVLARSGCSNGSCHGSARGQDGFHLSLFGYDPAGDYQRLTRELPGRRINLAIPEESLLLRKALGLVQHTGGKRFDKEDPRCAAMLEWLEAGAPDDGKDVARVIGLEIFPQDIVIEPGAAQPLIVRANYSDGTDRDVTALASLISNNPVAAAVDEQAVVRASKPGEVLVMARFDALAVGTQVIVVPDVIDVEGPWPTASNYVDQHVLTKLRKLRVRPSNVCSDEVFLRRVYLDIVGVLPTVEEHARFAADRRDDRRARLVDDLLERKEFVEIWVMKWAERLQLRSTLDVSYKSMLLYYNWLQDRVAKNVPMDKIVREIIASRGGTFTNPATNFYQLERDTLKLTENAAQAFMGVRIQCAQCHNHPFDRWTMDDYYGFAAFFAQVGRKKGEDPRETIVFNQGRGEIKHPVGQRVMKPKFLGGPVPDLKRRDRRAVLAEWMTSKDNRYFAENLANFVWSHFFGNGIVEPVDDARISNPASNQRLLRALADRLIAYKFDMKKLVRDICTSDTYQRTSSTNASNAEDERNFSHASIRRIRAEILLDCISSATETPNKFRGLPLGARAVQIADGKTTNYFLTTFGRAKRETVCTCEVIMEPNLSQALHLINGDTVHEKVKAGKLVPRLVESGLKPVQVIDNLYLRCLSRKPTEKERSAITEMLDAENNPVPVLEDLFWALLNSKEFIFNH